MSSLTPYVFFSGRCEEAINFYREHLGARVDVLMRYSENPEPPPPGSLPPGFESKVMHASLTINGSSLMVSDGHEVGTRGSGFGLFLEFPDEAAVRHAFDKLADGGDVLMPPAKTFWSPCFGMVSDRFGIMWMLAVPSMEQ